ncbi:MAG: hypothetical protein ACTSUE_10905 [Promethearchaeota archaeon]
MESHIPVLVYLHGKELFPRGPCNHDSILKKNGRRAVIALSRAGGTRSGFHLEMAVSKTPA